MNKYNNTYHSKIKMKPLDVNSSKYIDFNKENIKEDSKFEFRDQLRISKYKNLFTKVTLQIGLKKRIAKNKSKRVIKRKGDKNYMLNRKATIILLAVALIKNT